MDAARPVAQANRQKTRRLITPFVWASHGRVGSIVSTLAIDPLVSVVLLAGMDGGKFNNMPAGGNWQALGIVLMITMFTVWQLARLCWPPFMPVHSSLVYLPFIRLNRVPYETGWKMKTKLQFSLIFLLIASTLLSACGLALTDANAEAKSDLRRDTAPTVPAAETQTLLEGNNAFAFDLYRQVRGSDGNLIFSPYSISLAAALLYGGAGGETASQIAGSLHFSLPPDQLHPAMNSLALDLARRSAQSKKIDHKNSMQLSIANAVWGQRNYPYEKAYLDLLAVNYGAGVRLLDFAAAPDAARQQINDWVDQETQGKIKDMMPPGSLDPRTRLVLANAIYFKAAWQEAFVAKLTTDAPFTRLDGSQVQVPTMRTEEEIPLQMGSGAGYQVLALPYKGNLAEMVIILPDEGQFEAVEAALDASKYSTILVGLHPGSLILYMPKFEFSVNFDLIPVLSALGMPLAFDENLADFSGITKSERLYVYQALHAAYILVNEQGTEAAAATIFGVRPASLPQELHIDRPFIFVIRDVPTGTILFVGRVLDPLEKGVP